MSNNAKDEPTKKQTAALCQQPVEKAVVKSTRKVPNEQGRPVTARRTKKSLDKKAVLYTLDPQVILLVERVAYHAGEAKSKVVNELLRRELSKLYSSTIPTEWEQ